MLKREIISIHLERITSISKRSREEKKKLSHAIYMQLLLETCKSIKNFLITSASREIFPPRTFADGTTCISYVSSE